MSAKIKSQFNTIEIYRFIVVFFNEGLATLVSMANSIFVDYFQRPSMTLRAENILENQPREVEAIFSNLGKIALGKGMDK